MDNLSAATIPLLLMKEENVTAGLSSVAIGYLAGDSANSSSHSDKPQKVDAFASESLDALPPESLDDLRRNGWMTSDRNQWMTCPGIRSLDSDAGKAIRKALHDNNRLQS